MIDKATLSVALLTAMVGLPRPATGEEPLPPRALARIGDRRFYHGPELRCAVLSPDGRLIASTARHDSIIVLWDAATGERLRETRVPLGWSSNLAFSPDGKRLAGNYAISNDKSGVVLFDVETGKLLQRWRDFQSTVEHLQFSADGKQLHVSEWRGPVIAWDAATGKQLRMWKPPPSTLLHEEKEGVCAVLGVLSPNGRIIVWEMRRFRKGRFPEMGKGLRVHDASTNKLLYQTKSNCNRGPQQFAFSADGTRLVADCVKLTVLETATGMELARLKIPSMGTFVLAPDGRRVVIEETLPDQENYSLRLRDIDTGEPLWGLPFGHGLTPGLPERTQLFSANGKTLLLTTDSTLRLFDATTGKERVVTSHRTPVTPRFSADGRTLFTSCAERRCSWDVSSACKPTLLAREPRKTWDNAGLPHSADDRLFLDSAKGKFQVRETVTGRVLRELEKGDFSIVFGQFSPDATQVLLVGTKDRGGNFPDLSRLYEVWTGKVSCEIKSVDSMGHVVVSPNGLLIAWADHSGAVHLQDAATGKAVRTLRSSRPFPKAESSNNNLLFSPNTEYLIEARSPSLMRVFEVSSGREISRFYANPQKTFQAHALSCVVCSPDNRLLTVAEEESGIVRLFEIASGKLRAEFAGHRHGVHGLAFTPDGETLASGGEDNVVFLWDVTGARTPADGKKTPAESWNDLASEDAKRAGDAIADLLRKPEASVAFLKKQLRPAEVPEEERLTRLLADLDSDTFEKRAAASRELARLGERAETALRIALNNRPSLEARRRIEDLLSKLERRELPPETLRTLRAIEVLEHAGTAEARRCLDALAKGAAEARQTREAKRALDRLAKHRGKKD